MEIIKIKIADLTPYENNAKKHPKKQIEEIKNSIKKFGFCDPVGIWGEKNIIVEGHGRVLALQEMGETEVECIRLDHLTDDERKAYTLAHNQTTLSSDFDFEKLEAELGELAAADLDFSMADFGFDLSEFEEPQEITEDEAPEVDEESEPITQLGDIWQLGDHRLMCGDSTDALNINILMNGKKADMILSDPPYGMCLDTDFSGAVGSLGRKGGTRGNKYDKIIGDNDDFKLILCQSNAKNTDLRALYPTAIINPIGEWTGGTDVDTGATNRKLGSDMADSVTGGGLHGKDLSKADVSVNIYAFQKAQKTGKVVELCCAIGDEYIDGKPYSEIVEEARKHIKSVGGFEKFAEWGLF